MNLQQTLDQLPGTADGIAALFIERGTLGARKDTCHCPIAHHLYGTGEFDDAEVTEIGIDAFHRTEEHEHVAPAAHIGEFVRRFDAGEWPELEITDDYF